MEQIPAAFDQSPFATAREIAAFLKSSVWTVYERARAREIPCYTLGRRLLFDRQEVLQWLKDTHKLGPREVLSRRQVTPRRRRRKVR